ncbi:MAG TPA: GGDEF domain-containing protein [Acidimicrobiia bacterium]|jgi:diguanylate cyclase (GGDEF)-like protein
MSIGGWDHTRGPAAMARWLGTLYICGSTLSLISLALPHWHQQDTRSTAVCALLGYPMAALLFRFGPRLPRWAFHALLAVGTLIITLGVYFGHNAGGSLIASVFYIWVALYAFNFFGRRPALAHIGLVAAAYGAVLWIQHVPGGAAQWLLVVGTALVSGLVVAMLVEEVRTVARRDGLTGAWNRRALEEDLERVLAAATRDGFDVAFAILDLDRFKRCNDTLGHHGADSILMQVATTWSAELRPTDLLARFGGDEFAIVFPRSSEADAVAVLERLRAAAPGLLTFSAGVASWRPGEAADELEGRADALLYAAKRAGRDRIVAAGRVERASAPLP